MKFFPLFLLLFFSTPISTRANPIPDSLATLQAVGPEGKGNTEAAAAWKELTDQGSEIIVPTLEAMQKASPLARNWMRTAIETVFRRELDAGSDLPTKAIEEFLSDRKNEPNARRLAYDLFVEVDPDKAAELIPGMIDDPSPALRREAVAQLIDQGKGFLKEEKKGQSVSVLTNALDGARDIDQIEEIAKLLRGDLEQTVDLPSHFGFLMYWNLIAPFDNTDRKGFDEVFPPETEINLQSKYQGKEGKEVAWEEYSTSDDYGMVDFNQPFGPIKQVVGYAYTEFDSAEEREAELRLGCKNAWKIWLNGELLFGRDEYHRGIRIDQYTLPVKLKKGKNTLLVKACQNEQEQDWTVQWQFQLRVCDSTGTAIHSTDRKPTPKPNAKPRRRAAE
ncbi:MAG: hypothetical protein P1U87_20060 [Verrucomicrobiales bacterium]|nr:hypothetical protein [Verrucomicrobiales bacterium]